MKVWYLPLEPYRERYTEQLVQWTVRAYERHGHDVNVINGDALPGAERIRTGPVLDAHGRAHWALTQVARLVADLDDVRPDHWIHVDDLFTPGYEALPYVFDQLGWRPKVAVRNWAQSVDPDDFTFAMRRWMRPFERLVAETCDLVLVASTCHREMWQAANLPGRVEVVGLPFSKDAVLRQHKGGWPNWADRPRRVVYSSRLDREKQPHLFLDVVKAAQGMGVEFVVCSGSDRPRSNDPSALERLRTYQGRGWLTVKAGLTKADYYAVLAGARVHLNTARQDFVSFTALEASAFGTPTLAPAFRSFPEALENRAAQLYVPWSVTDCVNRLRHLLDHGCAECARLADYHDGTFTRTLNLMREAS